MAPLPNAAIGSRKSCPSSTISSTVRSASQGRMRSRMNSRVLPPPDLKTELRNFGQLGAVDHRGEIQPLLAGDHGDPNVAVLGRLDRGHSTVRETGGAWSSSECSHSPLCISVIASNMDRSRCSPGPPCSTRRRTANAPNAANTPPMYSPRSPPMEIGGPAGSPRKPVRPDHACKVNSLGGSGRHTDRSSRSRRW